MSSRRSVFTFRLRVAYIGAKFGPLHPIYPQARKLQDCLVMEYHLRA